LPATVIEVFVPATLWPVIETMIPDGPGAAAERAERVIWSFSHRFIPANKRRRAGCPSPASIQSLKRAFCSIFRQFVDLRAQYPELESLSQWLAVPRLRNPRVPPVMPASSAPPLPLARLAWQQLDSAISQQFRKSEGETELEALERLPDTALMQGGLFKRLRGRVFLGLLVTTGARIQALSELGVDDLIPDWRGPAPDHLRGPAIRLRPGKTLHPDHERVKPIPPELLAVIDVYTRYLERASGVRRDGEREWTRAGGTPLFVRLRLDATPWRTASMRDSVSGKVHVSRKGELQRVRPLIARIDGFNPDLDNEAREFVGYNPHAYRHLASQLAERAGRSWNEVHPPTGGEPAFAPGAYAAALLDHEMPEDRLRALYGDRNAEATRALLAGRAAYGIWELLTTDAGARRRPDAVAYRDTKRLVEALGKEKQALRDRLAQAGGAARAPTVDAGRLLLEMADTSQQLGRVNDLLDQARQRLRDLKHDRSTWRVLPDDAPNPGPVDLGLLDDDRAGDQDLAPPPRRVRDFLTVRELAELAGRGAHSTITRWLRGEHLPTDPQLRPWESDSVPVDESMGPRYRRIAVDRIKPSFWATEAMRRKRDEKLADWPEAQGWRIRGVPNQRCLAPLVLADRGVLGEGTAPRDDGTREPSS
jgi:hypothetical protein